MSDPLIHFLIPYVGRLDYLQECVSSVLAQGDSRWRATVVEDGEQGRGARGWLAQLSDSRIEHQLNTEPLGLSRNFQRCLSLASAPYVVILGCDDRLMDGYVSRVASIIQAAPGAALIQPGVQVIDENGRAATTLADRTKAALRPRGRMSLLEGERAARSLMRGNWMYFPSLCWRAEIIRDLGFRVDLPTTLDLELICRLILAGHSISVAPRDPAFEYRRHSSSVSSLAASALARFEEEKSLFRELEGAYLACGWFRAARAARWHMTSRLHALALIPSALADMDLVRVQRISRHVFRDPQAPIG